MDWAAERTAAIEREKLERAAALLHIPQTLCGIAVRPLTCRTVLELEIAESPFITGGKLPEPADIALFLWIVSDEKQNPRRLFRKYRKRRFYAWVGALDYKWCVEGIRDWVGVQFQDMPDGGGKPGPSYFVWPASYVALFGLQCRDLILNMPLAELWQYVRAALLLKDPKSPMANPSQRVDSLFLNELNNVGRN